MDPQIAGRLAKLCGMFGPHHVGERAAAALKADKLMREHGLTWRNVIHRPIEQPARAQEREDVSDIESDIRFAMAHLDCLNDWECAFIEDMDRQYWRILSPKQIAKIRVIVEKIDLLKSGERR
jgi:hypothetical protein